ncbi:chromatin-remodeling complex subunit ies6 [Pichia californica]|uniref:Chromatin-remodeling complex subunit ies6 n=1 Tax=Pichia californica TaxID=460514 RepID=A0A9P6WK35_9ASCO|nr:chromatin-remodeling complex subunit ies6 [[Candida] californica]KAG0688596.1 chromatin-remodeling complex subunit ies6 [[Candida] californica]
MDKETALNNYIKIFSTSEKFKNPRRTIKKVRYKGARLVMNEEQRRLTQLQEDEKLKNPDKPPADRVTYFSIAAPPSLKPIRTYCDVTGLPTNYKSPHNQIRYYNKECYEIVRSMPSGVDQQYLSLRGANVILK